MWLAILFLISDSLFRISTQTRWFWHDFLCISSVNDIEFYDTNLALASDGFRPYALQFTVQSQHIVRLSINNMIEYVKNQQKTGLVPYIISRTTERLAIKAPELFF